MSSVVIGGNPAVNQQGQPVAGTQIATVQQGTELATLQVPDWMVTKKEDSGIELMGRYVSPPRLKIVQGQSKQDLKQEFGESAIIMAPENRLVVGPITKDSPINPASGKREGGKIRCVPLFFFPEFLLTNPLGVPGLSFIRERTQDPESKIARLCVGRKEGREFPCPEDPSKMCKYSESLNFIVAIWEPGDFPEPALITFRAGSWIEGANWCKILKMMNQKQLPMYSQVFEINVGPRNKDQFDYYAFNVRSALQPNGLPELVCNPAYADGGQAWFEHAQALHREFKQNHSDKVLQVAVDDEEAVSAGEGNVIDTTATTVKF